MDEEGRGKLEARSGADESSGGLSMAELLELPAPHRRLLNWMIREREVGEAELAEFAAGEAEPLAPILAELLEKGLIRTSNEAGGVRYRVAITSRATRPRMTSKLWRAFDPGDSE